MNKEVKEKWIKALRSGDYKQTKGCLQDDKGFCCLGVLTDIYMKEDISPKIYRSSEFHPYSDAENAITFLYEDDDRGTIYDDGTAPPAVADWAGFPSPSILVDTNPSIPNSLILETYPNIDSKILGNFPKENPTTSLAELNDDAELSFEQLAKLIELGL